MKALRRLATASLAILVLLGVTGCVAWMSNSGTMSGMAMTGVDATTPVHAASMNGSQLASQDHKMPVSDCTSCQITQQNMNLPILPQWSVFGFEMPVVVAALLQVIVALAVIILSARTPSSWRLRPDLIVRLRQHRVVVILS